MDYLNSRKLICDTGRELLETGLVARTWGNVSCRIDRYSFLITPSGLDYTKTFPDDIVKVDLFSQNWQGKHRPSSEKGIHTAAYANFPSCNFVIHSHQPYASALGLAGYENITISAEERTALGGLARASYGLPGTKKLQAAVSTAMQTGAQTVLMTGHGVVICGENKEDALEKAALLENICKRNFAYGSIISPYTNPAKNYAVLNAIKTSYPYADIIDSAPVVAFSNMKLPLTAQLDDVAQMIGFLVPCLPLNAHLLLHALKFYNTVFVPGMGALVNSSCKDDTLALKLLVEKAAICALHTRALGSSKKLSIIDAKLMRLVYKNKYSKQKI